MLWIYYSSQILLFGAEFTQVYANKCGSRVEPSKHAVRIETTEVEVEPAEAIEEAAKEDWSQRRLQPFASRRRYTSREREFASMSLRPSASIPSPSNVSTAALGVSPVSCLVVAIKT